METITSLMNPSVKEAVKLRNRRYREEKKLFLIEGYRELFRASINNVKIKKLFICPKFFLGTNEDALIEKIQKQKMKTLLCNPNVFQKMSYRDRPDGLLAIAEQFINTLDQLDEKISSLKKDPILVITQSIEKPGNLGTILRSCDGAGVDGCIVCDPSTDIFNPNVVRSSIGTLFSQFVLQTSSAEIFSFLQKKKIKIVATSPNAKKVFTKQSLLGPLAIVMGSEQYGLSKFWLENSDISVKIPMLGIADSLNVATATTLLIYEVLRQRQDSLL